MHSLFVDSTSGLVVGLLNSQLEWLEYKSLDEKKPSEIIHFEIFTLIKKYGLELKNMRLFISNGPGSYTGMRLSEGLAQVFELSHIPVFSFYHFDVPRLSGVAKGFWATNAFKGQVFIYNWNGAQVEKILVDKGSFSIEDKKVGYTLDESDPTFKELATTRELIRKDASKIFTKVLEQELRMPPYYFRSLDEEFR